MHLAVVTGKKYKRNSIAAVLLIFYYKLKHLHIIKRGGKQINKVALNRSDQSGMHLWTVL